MKIVKLRIQRDILILPVLMVFLGLLPGMGTYRKLVGTNQSSFTDFENQELPLSGLVNKFMKY